MCISKNKGIQEYYQIKIIRSTIIIIINIYIYIYTQTREFMFRNSNKENEILIQNMKGTLTLEFFFKWNYLQGNEIRIE